jgi:pimeloyl-ACP methyl ester carboxylesterase
LFGDARTLVGIVTEPANGAASDTAFLLLNAGVVHRVGPNRIHVTAARRLAEQGFLAVRFDMSGLGDSGSRRDSVPFDQASVLEAREVMSAIQREYGIARFVTVGLCSGAVVAFRAAVADERVLGSVLINPQGFVQSEEWNAYVVNKALARKYWREKLLSPRSWRQALTGRSNYRQLVDVMRRRVSSMLGRNQTVTRIAGELAADFSQLQARGIRVLLACSEGDFGVDYLSTILGPRFGRREDMETLTLPRGDHSLTMAASQQQFFDGLSRWAASVRRYAAAPVRAEAVATAAATPRAQLS